jgi:WD40 repeat protein
MCFVRPPFPLFSIKLLVLSCMIYGPAVLGRGAERESQPDKRPQIVLHARATAISFSTDGNVLATAGDDKTVRLWDAATGKPLHSFKSHTLPVGALAFSPNGKLMASAGAEDKRPGAFELKLWDVKTGKVVHEILEKEHRSSGDGAPPMPFLAFSPDGAQLVFPDKGRTLCLWDVKAQKERWSLKIGLVPSTAAFSPDGKFLAIGTNTGGHHGTARIIHADTGKPERGLWAWYHGALQLTYSADGKQIFGGFSRKVFRRDLTESAKVNHPDDAIIWDPSKGGGADAMAFCSGGRLVALRAGDELKVLDTQSGKPKLTIESTSGPIAFSPDGRRLAASCQDGTTKVWDIR